MGAAGAATSGVGSRRVRPVRRVVIAIVTLVALAAEVGLAGVGSAGASTVPAVVNAAGGACQAYTFPDAAYEPVAFGSAVSRNTPTDVPVTTCADRVMGLASDPTAQGTEAFETTPSPGSEP